MAINMSPGERAALSELLQNGFNHLREIRIKKRVIALNILAIAYLLNVVFSPQRIVASIDLSSIAVTEAYFLNLLYYRSLFGVFLIVLYNFFYWRNYYFFPVSVSVLVVAALLFGFDFHYFISAAHSGSGVRVSIISVCRLFVLYLLFSNAMDASQKQ